jgi:hypothetical protein
MKFLALILCVPIHLTMFAMLIRTPPFFGYGYHILVSSLVHLFLSHMLLPLLGVQINIERLLVVLVSDFHTKKLKLFSNMVEKSSKVIHCHPWIFQRDTHLDGIPSELISVLFHPLSLFLLKVLPLHELLLFIAYGIK